MGGASPPSNASLPLPPSRTLFACGAEAQPWLSIVSPAFPVCLRQRVERAPPPVVPLLCPSDDDIGVISYAPDPVPSPVKSPTGHTGSPAAAPRRRRTGEGLPAAAYPMQPTATTIKATPPLSQAAMTSFVGSVGVPSYPTAGGYSMPPLPYTSTVSYSALPLPQAPTYISTIPAYPTLGPTYPTIPSTYSMQGVSLSSFVPPPTFAYTPASYHRPSTPINLAAPPPLQIDPPPEPVCLRASRVGGPGNGAAPPGAGGGGAPGPVLVCEPPSPPPPRGLLLTTRHHWGGGAPTLYPHPPWTPPPPFKGLGQIFCRAFSQSKIFSGAFSAN